VCTFPLILKIWRCHHEHPDTNKQSHRKQQSKGEGEKISPWLFYMKSSSAIFI
jgi:hypothetical protein